MYRSVVVLLLTLCLSSVSIADQRIITGVITNKLCVYSKDGKKEGTIKNVTDEEIQGIKVLGITPKKLVKVNFRGRDMYLRVTQLKLNKRLIARAEISPPGKPHTEAPINSGMGCNNVE